MARNSLYFACSVLLCVLAIGHGDDLSKTSAVTITVPPKTSIPTTEPPTTPTSPETTTTPPPPTQPTTTTTTTKPTPPTTPPSPSPSPAPTPAPSPLPPAEQGKWNVTINNTTCILLQFAARLNVTYVKNAGNKTEYGHALLNVPTTAAVVDGACGNDTQYIQLSWPVETMANNLTLQFNRNATTGTYSLAFFNATLTPDQHYPNASSLSPISLWHRSAAEWQTGVGASYRCEPPRDESLTEAVSGAVADVTLARLQTEAFRKVSGGGFSVAHECGGGDVPDAVPIAVGCALAGLVLVVLAAYLLGRRNTRGYLSM